MKIGIFGGTFDPFTKAHLEIVKKSLDIVDIVTIIPTTITYYRNSDAPPLFSFGQRIEIITKAIIQDRDLDSTRTHTLNLEYGRPDNWRFIDTIREVKKIWGVGKNDEVYIIVGSDTFDKLDTWAEGERIMKENKFIVAEGRYGRNSTNPLPHESILIENNNVSASDIRNKLTKLAMNNYIEWMGM